MYNSTQTGGTVSRTACDECHRCPSRGEIRRKLQVKRWLKEQELRKKQLCGMREPLFSKTNTDICYPEKFLSSALRNPNIFLLIRKICNLFVIWYI